jgi:tetratricopeptide (TPR) repeat protein
LNDSTGSQVGGHLSERALCALVERSVAQTQAFPWLVHLGFCTRCQDRVETLFGDRGRDFLERAVPGRDRPAPWFRVPETRDSDYRVTVQRAVDAASRVQRQVLEEEAKAVLLYDRLAGEPAARWELRIRNQRRFQTMGMLTLVLREARRARRGDPRRSEQLSRVALRILATLTPEKYGERLLRDRGALAWGYLGSALRAQGRLAEADRALQRGESLLPEDAKQAPDETAWLRLFRASLARDQRRFDEALDAILEARRLFRSVRDREHVAWTEVLEAQILTHQGNKERSATQLEAFLTRCAPSDVGGLIYLTAVQNLTSTLAQLGRGPQARKWLSRLEKALSAFAVYRDPLNRARYRWTEGLVYQALGDLERAAAAYREVQGVFVEHQIGYDAALVSLDLAAVLLDLGHSSEVLQLAEEMVPIFRSLQIEREAVAAALLFVESLRREQATAAAARAVAEKLKQAAQVSADL